jgi:hypothetical protein
MHPYYADIGPFYDDTGAAQHLGDVAGPALERRREAQTVLAMQSEDGRWLYPAWQFSEAHDVLPSLVAVLEALEGLDRWLAGSWLIGAHPALDDRSPRTALAEGVDPEVVAALAREDKATLVS